MIEGADKVGHIAAEVMEMVQEANVEEGLEAKVGVVAVAVEITVDEDDGPGWTEIRYRCSDQRRWIQAGFFDGAKRAVIEGVETGDEDDEE